MTDFRSIIINALEASNVPFVEVEGCPIDHVAIEINNYSLTVYETFDHDCVEYAYFEVYNRVTREYPVSINVIDKDEDFIVSLVAVCVALAAPQH